MIVFWFGSALFLVVFFGALAASAYLATRPGWKFLAAVGLGTVAAALLAGAVVYLDHLGQVP